MSDMPSPVQRFFGGLLMLVGGLLGGLSGLCTLWFIGGTIVSSMQGQLGGGALSSYVWEWVGMGLIVGGLPTVVGVGLFFLGRWMVGKKR